MSDRTWKAGLRNGAHGYIYASDGAGSGSHHVRRGLQSSAKDIKELTSWLAERGIAPNGNLLAAALGEPGVFAGAPSVSVADAAAVDSESTPGASAVEAPASSASSGAKESVDLLSPSLSANAAADGEKPEAVLVVETISVAPTLPSVSDTAAGSSPAKLSTENASTSVAIEARADEIARLGIYWGFMEWLAYGEESNTHVHVLWGANSVDLLSLFAPSRPLPGKKLYVVACRSDNGNVIGATTNLASAANHFVLALPLADAAASSAELPLDQTAAALLRCVMDADVASAYLNLGFAVAFTTTCGNCAPDTVAIHEGLPSAPLSWKRIRLRVSATMKALSSQHWFVEAYRAVECVDNGGEEKKKATLSASDDPRDGADDLFACGVDELFVEDGAASSRVVLVAEEAAASSRMALGIEVGLGDDGGKGEVDAKVGALVAAASCSYLSAGAVHANCALACSKAMSEEERAKIKQSSLGKVNAHMNSISARQHKSTLLNVRAAIGDRFLQSIAEDPSLTPGLFCARNFGYQVVREVPKSVRVFLTRCVALARSRSQEMSIVGKGYRKHGTTIQIVHVKRRRAHGLQGRPPLCPELREAANLNAQTSSRSMSCHVCTD